MKIGIQACGSTGDLQPMHALAAGLCSAGHEVTLYYTAFFGQVFSPEPVPGLWCESTAVFDKASDYSAPSRPIFALSLEAQMEYLIGAVIEPFKQQMSLAAEELCQKNELVIGVAMLYQLICMAEKYRVPFISFQVDNVYVPAQDGQRIWLDDWIEKNWAPIVNPYRASHGLVPVTDLRRTFYPSKILNLLAFSPVLEPKQPHWGDTVEVCGYFHGADTDTALAPELKNFLDAGPPPIFISLGSMMFYEPNPAEFHELLLSAVKLADCRAIIQLGNNSKAHGQQQGPVYYAGYLPHHKLLPHCVGMVHHGGSGTVHTALKQACPSITVAYAFDQFFWGRKLVDTGVAPGLLSRRLVDEVQLAGDIRKLMRYPDYKNAATLLRRYMKREDGVRKAVSAINRVISPG